MGLIIKFFDKLEDRMRGRLSKRPIIYAFLGGVGIVLFWRGVWHTADWVMEYYFLQNLDQTSMHVQGLPWWDGLASFLIGSVFLLITGVFVSNFIGNEIILSGLRGEKKLAEKTVDEVKTETGAIGEIRTEVKKISAKLDQYVRK
ncbi:MAG: hypothetical protein A3B10_04010 [Candidatus Doudnabacteria bacterium RIFCSPLOWO2_01_FULL_44_21]|uniref:Uncharacterized protein n=1 Tax=Candidatus Doudnabacteria bacterium RIFCSPLOWO2_01_FULL_44_21 TaxID=1817841 RepID=A0A1F5Q550_9BACT|nr:MAG: hypothetical protein A3B95_00750 [Candidatus Doudnabacteria bacterium RIFCSPHIGHO2_02_FULL_43_13b]OGE97283.1 MAG: hypothetical protein A3B10_04010 [Candidatus Doudnabacteria bacterium RIFCSPLOWO2_01_FULL_44_21]